MESHTHPCVVRASTPITTWRTNVEMETESLRAPPEMRLTAKVIECQAARGKIRNKGKPISCRKQRSCAPPNPMYASAKRAAEDSQTEFLKQQNCMVS